MIGHIDLDTEEPDSRSESYVHILYRRKINQESYIVNNYADYKQTKQTFKGNLAS